MTAFSPIMSLILVVCALAYVGVGIAIWRLRVNRAYEQPTGSYKLLRGAGESLRQKINTIDSRLLQHLLIYVTVPPLAILGNAIIATLFFDGVFLERFFTSFIYIIVPLTVVFLVICAIDILRLLATRSNHYLGYFGERIVGENIDRLQAAGYRVYHDVPATTEKDTFNIDHVIIGPTGIFAIETKTRRKGSVRPGYIDGKIIYDGEKLIYPWGEDSHGLDKSHRNAIWLDKHLARILDGQINTVLPILTFPGWRIEQTGRAGTSPIRVLSPGQIADIIKNTPTKPLAPAQIESISRELETLCRDVEY